MQRKGPDGKTIGRNDEASEEATRKVPRRSIRERLLAQEEPTAEDLPATHVATAPTSDSGNTGSEANRATAPGADATPTVYAGGASPGQREGARPDASPKRDYVPADPPRGQPATGAPPPTR